uniref:speedy protein A-like n=1 Tax=Ciona intestinalis TaxID=7719 RepID=UPI000180BA9B|nr:speedy protein A-like [Ciona intestinalis]XP_026691915.1 speedy protein A-like [Ciona intestinalis]XP_026691916.1 speedy protein A-like [Ciona intestinalis]XP_026691917.1 speedy protein A-like [Ciona intestinalis]|eukprot:XP_002122378.1 speedy protein A-like [Ciona intestinalis]
MSKMNSNQVVTKYVLYLSNSQHKSKKRRLGKCQEAKHDICVPTKRSKESMEKLKNVTKPCLHITINEIDAFFSLFEDNTIQEFLALDSCFRISDKYLLAMVLTYFKRAHLHVSEYNVINFFTALYLANDMAEDEEEFKYEIFPWALGEEWRDLYPGFLAQREKLWRKMKHRASVSRKCCEEAMEIQADHEIWSRERNEVHGGAKRNHLKSKEEKEPFPRGPGRSPIPCSICVKINNSSGYYSDDSIISDDMNILHVSTDSSPDEYFTHRNIGSKPRLKSKDIERGDAEESSFDMEKLWETLS